MAVLKIQTLDGNTTFRAVGDQVGPPESVMSRSGSRVNRVNGVNGPPRMRSRRRSMRRLSAASPKALLTMPEVVDHS